jgi:hypothetical protein
MKAAEVSFAALERFGETFAWRIEQAAAARTTLAQTQTPALGEFRDALLTARRHHGLVEDHLERLRRLMWALVVVRDVTSRAVIAYRRGDEAGLAALADVARLLDLDGPSNRSGPGSSRDLEAGDAGHRRA